MTTFSKLISTGTKVMLSSEYGYRKVEEVMGDRKLVKVAGIQRLLGKEDVHSFTNREGVEMYPAVEDLYVSDQYGSVYERGEDANTFIGKLNGRTLKKFAAAL